MDVDGNTYFLNKYLDEQEVGEISYEAYCLKMSDVLDPMIYEMSDNVNDYLLLDNFKTTGLKDNFKDEKERLSERIFEIYEDMYSEANALDEDNIYDDRQEIMMMLPRDCIEVCNEIGV